MKKSLAVRFVCSNCGAVSSTWTGRCQTCGEWNTLEEQVNLESGSAKNVGHRLKIETLKSAAAAKLTRLTSGVHDIDELLGDGFVAGSVNLLAGQPGVGKSTLLTQIAKDISAKKKVLYISGEESAQQVAMRARRLGATDKLDLAISTIANDIAATISGGGYNLVIVDSIQTITVNEIASSAGSVSQITNGARLLSEAAKSSNTVLILVGHVTKEGSIAGPKILEHMVDVVLQLEGDSYGGFKVLRASKNRYGPTTEAAILEMTDAGLRAVDNPSAALLAERQVSDGSIVHATVEGSRPILVEIQALVNPTSYGYPKRTASGIDLNRVNLLIAMLERRTKLKLSDKDIFINVVGGLRLTEPAADLAVCMAIGSAAKGLQLKRNAVVFGEVGLSGEVRHVPYLEKRINEAKKLKFEAVIGPRVVSGKQPSYLLAVNDVRSALNSFLEKD